MKANEFVKKFGWDEAKFIAEYCNEKVTKVYNLCDGLYSDESVSVDDLKRLVESYELVESYGGIDKAKSDTSFPVCFGDNDFFREVTLKKAIADVESCQ